MSMRLAGMLALAVASAPGAWAVELAGTVEVIVEMTHSGPHGGHEPPHGAHRGPAVYHYRLRADDGTHHLLRGSGLERLATGARVRVEGRPAGAAPASAGAPAPARTPIDYPELAVDRLVIHSGGYAAAALAAGSRTIGRKTVHVVRPVRDGQPLAPPRAAPDDPVAVLYRKLSNGKLDLQVTYFEGNAPWEQITDCSKGLKMTGLPADVRHADYYALIRRCTSTCFATVGGDSSTCFDLSEHELGHNFGFYHANALGCRENDVPVAISTPENCGTGDYGDPFDLMGKGAERMLNAYHLDLVGWLDPHEKAEITQTGTHTLFAIDEPGKLRALKVRSVWGHNYWIEFRRGHGVQLRLHSRMQTGDTQLLRHYPPGMPAFESVRSLRAGDRFEDKYTKLYVTVLSSSAAAAVVQVRLGDAPAVLSISAVEAAEVGASAATIRWLTDLPADSALSWEAPASGAGPSDPALKTAHSLRVSGLLPQTRYAYRVRSRAPGGAEAEARGELLTLSLADTTPPVLRIASPSDGATIRESAPVYVEASDDRGITRFELYDQGTLLKTTPGEP